MGKARPSTSAAALAHPGEELAVGGEALLTSLEPGRATTLDQSERWHRDAAGNPGRLVRLDAAGAPARAHVRPARIEPAAPAPAEPQAPIVPTRPPLVVEEGLIEVGWEPEAEPRPAEPEPRHAVEPAARARVGDEVVDDHYAALQAWNEWAANQGRAAATATLEDEDADISSPVREDANLRAEGPEEFAPYSQLFSRMKQARGEE